MNVFTLYNEPHARHLRLWMRSWKQHGYRPQLIALRELEDSTIKRVVRRRGGGIVVRPGAFNLGHRRGKPACTRYGARGWQTAGIVVFPPGMSEDVLLEYITNAP